MTNGTSNLSLESEGSTCDGQSNVSQETTIVRDMDGDGMRRHARSVSGVTAVSQGSRVDRFQLSEVKDILLCFLFVVKYIGEESLIAWWQKFQDGAVLNFFSVIE